MTKHSNRNGGRPALPPERRRIRITITLPPEDVQALVRIDANRSAAIHKLVTAATRPPTAPDAEPNGARSATATKAKRKEKAK